jgi:hypothetical protein
MPEREPRNPFYFLLLVAGVLFAVTAIAYAVLPVLEEKATAAGQPPPPSPFRDALREDGWLWLLIELTAVALFGFLSMVLDRLRSLKMQRAAATMPAESGVRDQRSRGSDPASDTRH